jgi:hypothetical protein
MSWNFEEISKDWIAGSVIAASPEEVVAAFDRCEQAFGRDWINQTRGQFSGADPTLRIVTLGQRLASLNGVKATDQLIEKLRKHDTSAAAELHAIHLLCSSTEQTAVELFPTVIVGGRERQPDFRVRRGKDAWVYAEVTHPDIADAHRRASGVLDTLSSVIESISRPFDLEVFLRREPTDAEVREILRLCEARGSQREELPGGLGLLLWNDAPSGPIVPSDHGEEVLPRLGQAKGKVENGVLTRRVVVRVPYADERAEKLLHRESAQLPTEGPGLVMVQMGNAPGGFKSWEALILRRFQPTVHTRVSAVCLFSAGTILTEAGFVALSQTKVLVNPFASTPVPPWIESVLTAAGAAFRAIAAPEMTNVRAKSTE